MADPTESENERRSGRWPIDVPFPHSVDFPTPAAVADLGAELRTLATDARPDVADIETALAGVAAPRLDGSEIEASVRSIDGGGTEDEADAVIDAGGEPIRASIMAGGDAATILLDGGEEALEVVVENGGEEALEVVVENGGEEAAEVVLEVMAAALKGV